jgi:hypothetical protein
MRWCCAVCHEVRASGIRLVQQRTASSSCYNRLFWTSTFGEGDSRMYHKVERGIYLAECKKVGAEGSILPPSKAALLTSNASKGLHGVCGLGVLEGVAGPHIAALRPRVRQGVP